MNNEGQKYTIELPWFDSTLTPNGSQGNWRKKAAAKKKQRAESCLITKTTIQNKPRGETLEIKLTYHPPDRRRRDLDNCLAATKGALDGVADALGVDDRNFRPITVDFGDVCKGGKIILEIIEIGVDA